MTQNIFLPSSKHSMEQPLGDINIVCVHVSASPKNEEKKNDKRKWQVTNSPHVFTARNNRDALLFPRLSAQCIVHTIYAYIFMLVIVDTTHTRMCNCAFAFFSSIPFSHALAVVQLCDSLISSFPLECSFSLHISEIRMWILTYFSTSYLVSCIRSASQRQPPFLLLCSSVYDPPVSRRPPLGAHSLLYERTNEHWVMLTVQYIFLMQRMRHHLLPCQLFPWFASFVIPRFSYFSKIIRNMKSPQ